MCTFTKTLQLFWSVVKTSVVFHLRTASHFEPGLNYICQRDTTVQFVAVVLHEKKLKKKKHDNLETLHTCVCQCNFGNSEGALSCLSSDKSGEHVERSSCVEFISGSKGWL